MTSFICAFQTSLWGWAYHYLGISSLFPCFQRYRREWVAIPANHPVGKNNTPPFLVDQPIPDKTDNQQEVEVKDPKVVAAREKKKAQVARAAAKKKEIKKMGNEK
ncbi:hypothetical protein Tco_0295022 [Tanacetum coccineum]